MELITYPNATTFLEQNQVFLEEQEVVNSLLLGLAIRAANNPEREQPLLLSAMGMESQQAAILKTPGRFGILAQSNMTPLDHKDFARLLTPWKEELPGVIAAKEVALSFAEAWEKTHGIGYQVKMRQMVYRLEKVSYPDRVAGALRLADKNDLDILADWIYQFNNEATLESQTPEGALLVAHRRIEKKDLFVWEHHEPVSMAGISRPTRNGVTINAVYTPPEFRKKGYASACVAHLSGQLLKEGYRFCTLFTDLDYPTSNKIYQDIGYRPESEFRMVGFHQKPDES